MKMRVALGIIDHRMENRWKELLHYPSDQIGDLRIVYDATELLEVSRMMVANLVIIELKLPGLQENKCIGQIRETNENCSFIAIGTGRNYDELLEAFENRMDAFLAEPLEKEDVCRTIERIAFETEMRQQEEISRQYRYAARQLFASKTYQMNTKHTDMATTNELMCTNFQPGYFQTILLCADFQGDRQTFLSYLPQLQKIWLSSIVDLIGDICFDILYDNSKEGLTLFLNYAEDKRLNIQHAFTEILTVCQKAARENMVVTLCVGGIYNTLAGFKESKDEAMVTKWNRMDVGRGNVMYSNLVEFHPDYAEKMKQLFADMYRAVDIANYTQFDRAVTTLFMLPRIALARYRFREGISQFLVYFIHEDQRIFSEYFEIEKLASQIDDELDHQSTLKKFENCFRRWAQILFEKLESTSGMQDAMLIRKAKQYVRDHYDGHINIQTVADQVGLSAVYFSHLYKIKTGENFTEYVCAYRIEKGKELLRDSELNVNEIAAAAGFSDPRYFSRKFKEAVGVTPSQFRKISDAKK